MKKTIKRFFIIVCVQLMIISLFSLLLYESKSLNDKHIKQAIIVVDDIEYIRIMNEFRFSVFSNSIQYQFSNDGALSPYYSNRDLYENVDVGDKLNIIYIEKYRLTGKQNLVVDARTEKEIYRSLEYYNTQKNYLRVFIIVFFSVVEMVYLFIISTYNIILKRTR